MGSRAWRAAALTVALLPLAPGDAPAAGWTVTPAVEVRGTYTDNVALGTRGEGDFITQVTPSLRIEGRGARLRGHLRYAPRALFYADHDEANGIANSLDAFASLEAIENFFFVDVTGSMSQSFLSPFAPQPGDVATLTDNRVETRTLGVSPYVRGQLGRGLTYELRNRNLWTASDREDTVGDVHSRQWSGRLASPVRRFGWALELDDSEIDHDDLQNRPEQRATLVRARGYFQPDVNWRLSASVGREENNYLLQEERSYTMRGVGLVWTPTPRTTAELEYERRFFGPSRLASFAHRTRLTAWRVAYSRSSTNYQNEVLRLPPGDTAALLDAIFAARIADPAARSAAVEEFLRSSGTPQFLANPLSFFTQQIFVQERVEASLGLLGVRNSITFTAFNGKSTALAEGVGALLPELGLPGREVRQRGFGASASHRLTPFTTLGASASRTVSEQEAPAGLETRNDNLTATLTRRLGPKTHVFAGLARTRFASELAADTRDANSVYAGLSHQF